MKHLLRKGWPSLREKFKKSPVFLFLDYDGTLAPIVRNPDLAVLSPSRRKQLKQTARTKKIRIALVSGRSLSTLKKLAGVRGLLYVGNHGLEREENGSRRVHPAAQKSRKLLHRIKPRLQAAFRKLSGIFVEDKDLTLTVHYRRASLATARGAKKVFWNTLGAELKRKQIRVTEGKKVWEIRPPVAWGKGNMVVSILKRAARNSNDILPVYIGDDATDEDAFRALGRKGVTVKVGEKTRKSRAAYYLKSTGEVFQFLKRLSLLKGGGQK